MPLLKLAEHYFYILSRFFRVDSFFRPFRFALCHSSLYQKVKFKQTDASRLADQIFEIVDQRNFGRELLDDDGERYDLAKLNLMAGQKAKSSAAYQAARDYFVTGIELLPREIWADDYELAFVLHLQAAECEYLSGRYAHAEALFPILFNHAKSNIDRAKIYAIEIVQYINQKKFAEAVCFGKESLSLFGVILPEIGIEAEIAHELKTLKANLANQMPDSLLDLPLMTDPEKQMFLTLASHIHTPFYVAQPSLALLLGLKAVNVSLRHGYAHASIVAYGSCGQMLGTMRGEFDLGYELGQLGANLSEKLGDTMFRCKAYVLAAITSHWCRPKNLGDALFLKAYQSGIDSGDLHYASLACGLPILGYFTMGRNLDFIDEEIRKFEGFLKATDHPIFDLVLTAKQSILALKGLTENRSTLMSEGFDEELVLERASSTSYDHLAHWYYVRKMQLALLYDDIPGALEMSKGSEKTVGGASGQISVFEHYFYSALTLTALYTDALPEERQIYWENLKAKQYQLKVWADNCPENFNHAYLLVSAEMARMTNNNWEATELYDQAIESAAEHGFLQNEALANELAAKFWLSKGKMEFAQLYLTQSHAGYQRWGATKKVKDLEERYPYLAPESPEKTELVITTSDYSMS
ncbi:hypothetical protein KFU94_24305 [Chloroflexi bacterium TSY]|nr:hypothetical protein [Chloroflexi bacterium TSY]